LERPSMPTIPLTRSKHLLPFAAFMRRHGEPVDRLVQKAKLPRACFDDPDTLIPSDAAFHFRELTASVSGRPNVAHDATEGLGIADLGDFGRALLRAPMLARLLDEFQRLTCTETSMASIELTKLNSGDYYLCHHFQHSSEHELWHSDLYILQWTIKLVRLVDAAWAPNTVWISSTDSKERCEVLESLGAAVPRFGSHCTGFVVQRSMLSKPLTKSLIDDPSTTVEGDVLLTSRPAETYAESLKQLLNSYASDGWLGIAQASEVTGTSRRTMQRRLAAEKTTYTRVVDDTRSELAASLLEDTNAGIDEIASCLGYTKQANFTRAFRRWSGVSPSEFRGRSSPR